MDTVIIGLGSNLGDRLQKFVQARAALARHLAHMRCSSIYETAPWGVTDQPAFLNAVCQGQTTLAPHTILAELKQIEHELGRVETRRWGPRVIDLDLLFYNDLLLDSPTLTLPHLHLHARAFVLVPLADLAPNLVHPRLHMTIAELLQTVDRRGVQHSAVQWPT